VAWHQLGWEAAGFAEIEPFPAAVLAHHYPAVKNLGDMTNYKEWDLGTVDLLVGGTPCQSFSVAGLRKGLADPRGNLALVYCGILDHFRPKWCVWENVPGVLSSNGGRDFGSFLGALAELGYGFAYRVLDAQYFGVAQRRRRVFVVGYLGDWRPAAEVLFEPESLRRDPAPSREARKGVAGTLKGGSGSRGYPDPSDGNGGGLTVVSHDPAPCLETTSHDYSRADGFTMIAQPIAAYALQGAGHTSQNSQGSGWNEEVSFTLNRLDVHGVAQPIVYDTTNITSPQNGSNPQPGDPCFTLAKGQHPPLLAQPIPFGVAEQPDVGHCLRSGASKADKHESTTYVAQPTAPTLTATNDPSRSPQSTEVTNQVAAVHAVSMAVRRLTPVECERLQGFPDGYTNIPWRKQPESPDGPRYKALGNSMAVPVMAWIGRRIQTFADLQ
jgi:DNA (cytosine-5)-methyltransferase 1